MESNTNSRIEKDIDNIIQIIINNKSPLDIESDIFYCIT